MDELNKRFDSLEKLIKEQTIQQTEWKENLFQKRGA